MKKERDKQLMGGRIERVEAMLFHSADSMPVPSEPNGWQSEVMRDVRRTVIDVAPQREFVRFALLSSSFAAALVLLALRADLDPVQEVAALSLESEMSVVSDYDLVSMEQLMP